jgi:hypothetical protein
MLSLSAILLRRVLSLKCLRINNVKDVKPLTRICVETKNIFQRLSKGFKEFQSIFRRKMLGGKTLGRAAIG